MAITPGSWLENLLETREIEVNSIHRQGIRRLAPGLTVEATAPDGVVEAVTLPAAPGFVFGVQWHPEYRAWENPYSQKIFAAFGAAVSAYREQRLVAEPTRS